MKTSEKRTDLVGKLLEDEDEERRIYKGSWLESCCLGVKVEQGITHQGFLGTDVTILSCVTVRGSQEGVEISLFVPYNLDYSMYICLPTSQGNAVWKRGLWSWLTVVWFALMNLTRCLIWTARPSMK